MNWLLAVLAGTGLLAGPVVASVVAPSLMTDVAESGIAVSHHHFVFDKTTVVRYHGQAYTVHIGEGDLYEMPLTSQLVLRGSVMPPPSDEVLQAAMQHALKKSPLPILGHQVERDGEGIVVKATLPAGVLARLSPQYQEKLAQYEQA